MLILYGNIYKVTRNRLPADVRLRRGPSLDRDPRRPESRQTTTATPLIRSNQSDTAATKSTRSLVQIQRVNCETSSSSSEGGQSGTMLRQMSGSNVECFEMTSVEEQRQTASQPDVDHPQVRPTAALKTLRVWRSTSSPQSGSSSVARASLFSRRNSSSKNEWRRTSCLAAASEAAARRENKAAKTLAIVVGGFVSCWLPFFVLYVVEPFCSSCRVSDAVRSVLTWLGYANSLVNPFIYATYNRHFRHSFWSLTVGRFHACMPRTNRPYDVTEMQVTL